ALGSGIGKIAVDAANAGLADLGNLFEQTIRNLGRGIVSVDQNSETGRAEFRRHDLSQSLNRRTSSLEAAPWTAMDGYTDVGALAARLNFPLAGNDGPQTRLRPISPQASRRRARPSIPLRPPARSGQASAGDHRSGGWSYPTL